MFADVRYAGRRMRAAPGFTAAIVVTLALGIGANATMFGVVDRLLFRAPPLLKDPDTAHRIYVANTSRGTEYINGVGRYVRFEDYKRWTTSCSAMAGHTVRPLAIGTGEDAREMTVGVVSYSFFDFFDAPPLLGRYFTAVEDTTPAGAPVAVLSYTMWQTQYGGRPDVLGSALQIGSVVYTVIGVTPRAFVGLWPGQPPAAYIPITSSGAHMASCRGISADWYATYSCGWMNVIARRKPGVTLEQANADLTQAQRRSYAAMRLYDVDPVLVVFLNMRGATPDSAQDVALRERLRAAASAVPGVVSASRQTAVPLWSVSSTSLWVPGIDSVERIGRFNYMAVSPGHFETMGTRVLRGRPITEQDQRESPRVAVVSQNMARALWPGREAVGQCMRVGDETLPCATVVGIAENIRGESFTGDSMFYYYVPITQFRPRGGGLFVRVNGDAADYQEPVRRALQREMPGAAYVIVTPFDEIVSPKLRSLTMGATMFVAFGALALLIAAIGLYSVISYAVAQRTHELGVRLALGARGRDLARLVVVDSVRIAGMGVGLGVAGALWAARWLEPLLYEISPRDASVYVLVAGTLLLVSVAASWIPARRAARTDPNVALRAE